MEPVASASEENLPVGWEMARVELGKSVSHRMALDPTQFPLEESGWSDSLTTSNSGILTGEDEPPCLPEALGLLVCSPTAWEEGNRGLRTDREDCQRFSSRRLFLLSFRLPIAFNAAPFILRWLPSSFPLPDSSICDVSSLLRFGALYCLTISQHLLFLFLYSLQLFSCIYLLLVSVSQVTSTELILYFLPPCRCWWWLQNNHPFFKHVLIQGPSVTLLFLWIQPLCRLMIRRSSVITLCFKVKSVPMSASEGQEDDILDLVAFALKDDFILLYLSH